MMPSGCWIIIDYDLGLVLGGTLVRPTTGRQREFKGIELIIVETVFLNGLEDLATSRYAACSARWTSTPYYLLLWVYHIKPADFEETSES